MHLIDSTSDLAIICQDLTFDGDSHQLRDGYTITLRAEPDPDASIFDEAPQFVGLLEPVTWDDCGAQQPRPAAFNGAARIIDGYRGERYWWQPPAMIGAEG